MVIRLGMGRKKNNKVKGTSKNILKALLIKEFYLSLHVCLPTVKSGVISW